MANELIKPGEMHAEYNVDRKKWRNVEDFPIPTCVEGIIHDLKALLLDLRWRAVATQGLLKPLNKPPFPRNCGVALYLNEPTDMHNLPSLIDPEVVPMAYEQTHEPSTSINPGKVLELGTMPLGKLSSNPPRMTPQHVESLPHQIAIDQLRLRPSQTYRWEPPVWKKLPEQAPNVLIAEFRLIDLLANLDLAIEYRLAEIESAKNEVMHLIVTRGNLGNKFSP